MLRTLSLLVAALCGMATLGGVAGCGDISLGKLDRALSTCEDRSGQYHFRVMIPPWKHNKEYRCTDFQGGKCLGTWVPTGRYVFVVSDVPFVNFDSEIVSSLDVELTTGDTQSLVQQLIATESIGVSGSNATFFGPAESYPKPIAATEDGGLAGHEILWRQKREFEGRSYDWYRRDVFLQGAGSRRFHIRLFSIGRLDGPEFNAIFDSFREGPSEDGAPNCQCRDEHDPSGPKDC